MKRFKNILYVANSEELVHSAFHQAVGLAERNDARLTVLMVTEPIPPYLTRLTPHVLRHLRNEEQLAELQKLCAWVSKRVEIEAKIVEGTPFLEIIREALRYGRDLVVKATEQDTNIIGRLFGTTDMHLLRKCPCPVWLIKPTNTNPTPRILAAVDFNDLDPVEQDTASPLNRNILEIAMSLAAIQHSELHVAHAWYPIGESFMRAHRSGLSPHEVDTYVNDVRLLHQNWLERLMSEAVSWIGKETYEAIAPKIHLPMGRASEVIPELVGRLKVELVAMGTVGRTGIPGFIIGNTAETILEQIDCSVLAVKPEGFVTPVSVEQ